MTTITPAGATGVPLDQVKVPPPPRLGRNALVVKAVVGTVAAAVLVSVPFNNEAFTVNRYTGILCFAIAAAGLNLLTGFNGQISVGHGAFFGIGAYTTAILVADHGLSFYAAMPVAMALTFVVGLVVGLPALRIHGLYLALVTLALATLFPQFVVRFRDLTGGASGKQIPLAQRFESPFPDLADDQARFLITLAIAAVVFVAIGNLVHSRTGRALVALRDNEAAATTLGVDPARTKVAVFGLSAMLAGLGGSLSVMNTGSVAPQQYNITLSIELLVAVVVGGTATILGPALGAFLIEEFPEWLPDSAPTELSPVVFAGTLIVLMMVAPGGILGLGRRLWAAVVARRATGGSPPGPGPEGLPSTPPSSVPDP